jgi:PqqD family protein of HPr-rel-A system
MAELDPSREPEWRAGPAQDLIWVDFGDDCIVYHRPSGKTHFLNGASALLLKTVLLEPKTARVAAEELAACEQAVGDAEFFATVAESLEQLAHLGLVERSGA